MFTCNFNFIPTYLSTFTSHQRLYFSPFQHFLLTFQQLGVVGFLTVIGLSSSKSGKKSTTKKTTKKAPATPKRTPSKKEAAATRMAAKKGATGSVETPAGRRSARIARKKVEQ